MEAIIVGGGMGGLCASLALEKSGAFKSVTVFEQAPVMTTEGVGITVQPNGARVCKWLGVDLRGDIGKAAVLWGGRIYNKRNDVYAMPFDQAGYGDGAGFHQMHRYDVLAVLMARVEQRGIAVQMGKRMVSLKQDHPRQGRVTVMFNDGSSAEADVVIGADGIKSRVRASLFPDADVQRWTDVAAFRGIIPRAKVEELELSHPMPDPRLGLTADTRVHPSGKSAQFAYWIQRGNFLNTFTSFHQPDPSMFMTSKGVSLPISNKDMQRQMAELWGDDPRASDVVKLLGAVEKPFLWGLFDRDALEHWHVGHVAVLGDAAHAMLPTFGQGINMAFEDAGALGKCFERYGTDIAKALLHYERVRHYRTGRFQTMSKFLIGELMPPPSYNRDKLLLATDERDVPSWIPSQRAGPPDERSDWWILGFNALDIGDEMPTCKWGPWDFRKSNPIRGAILDNLWMPPTGKCIPAGNSVPRVTRAEVAKHNTLDDAWIIVHKNVYNFTEWNEHHPGGTSVGKLYAGKDCTAEFGEFHSRLALNHMAYFLVAELDEEAQPGDYLKSKL